MRQSQMEKYREQRRKALEPEELDFEGLAKKLVDGDRPKEQRQLNPTQLEFICDPAARKAYMGRAGAAKTTTLNGGVMLRCLLEPGNKELVARHDYNDLMDTTYRNLERMLLRLPPGTRLDRNKNPPEKWWIRPINDGEPSEITFMGLKDAVGSYEFNHVNIDEADEVDYKRIEELEGRLRNLRPGVPQEENNYSINLAFNPPPKHHALYLKCTGRDERDRKRAEPVFKLFVPKMGENQRNLPADYYEKMTVGMSEDLKQRLVLGQWVEVFPGEPVYRQFKRTTHVRRGLKHAPWAPIIRFWDFGYRSPYCGFLQSDHNGALRVLYEVQGENIEAKPFATMAKKAGGLRFPGHTQFIDFGDPAARQRKDTGSTLQVLTELGIALRYRVSRIEEGLRLIRTELGRLIEGEPAILFDEEGCPILISAMSGGYRMDDKGKEPVKDGYYDHSADAFRYGIINLFTGGGMFIPPNLAFQPGVPMTDSVASTGE